MERKPHPTNPISNVSKFSGYEPDKYAFRAVPLTVVSHEALSPGCPPRLTQVTIDKYLVPTTLELAEVAPKPTIYELPDAVIEQMVKKDKAFWVDKPGANAYTLHDAYYTYGMTTEVVKPTHQDVFPRSYQYDLDCVRYRRHHACDGMKQPEGEKTKPLSAHCRDCGKMHIPALTPFQLAWAKDPGQKRWRYYPDLTATLTSEEIRESLGRVGRPFRNEACNWYYENYPPAKFPCILRKFAK